MSDEVLVSKTAMIEHCVKRAREEYEKDPTTFFNDITRRDAATLNVIRAWEAAVEMGDEVIGTYALGTPEDEREVFTLLCDKGWIDAVLAEGLKRTGEFCRAEWDYQAGPLQALVTIIKRGLDDLLAFARALLTRDAAGSSRAPLP
jgi:uncharacterized protein YutE (UPF0331/DUF86 family)